jgi:hypothetical protein
VEEFDGKRLWGRFGDGPVAFWDGPLGGDMEIRRIMGNTDMDLRKIRNFRVNPSINLRIIYEGSRLMDQVQDQPEGETHAQPESETHAQAPKTPYPWHMSPSIGPPA